MIMFLSPSIFAPTTIQEWVKSQKISPSQVAGRLQRLLRRFELTGDVVRAARCRDLLYKAEEAEFVIAFCGHFSAGKSTMINELMGHDLLPTNPIPTSANVVKVKTGPACATVVFKEKGEVIFPYPYDREEIQAYCTDGDRVERVEISHPNDQLPSGVAILDTPGIDSTDDAHRVAAESSLHTADVVLYVMDYNHVQAQVNGEFIAMLKERMKETWLIVNQIDKHVTFEVAFTEFQHKIAGAFAAQGPLFFTTVREPGHPHNDLSQLKQQLAEEIARKRERIVQTVLTEAYLLVRDHLVWCQEVRQAEIDTYLAVLDTYQMSDGEKIAREIAEVKEQEASLSEEAERFEREFGHKLDQLFKNANLMPYHTRELARAFVESRQMSFRVGRLFAKNRTKEEKEKRLARFHKEVCENAATYIDIHLKKMMLDHLAAYGIENESLRRSIYELKVPITREMLVELINKGAMFNHEYVIRYASVVVDAIRQVYTQAAKEKMEEALADLKKNREQKAMKLAQKRTRLLEKQVAAQALGTIAAAQEHALRDLFAALEEQVDEKTSAETGGDDTKSMRAFQKESENERECNAHQLRVHIGRKQASARLARKAEACPVQEKAQTAIVALEQSARVLAAFPGFRGTVREFKERAERLKERQYTIALFGAFSAGKSSFANALLGDTVLPVSPHPTTATINYVLPPTDKRPHGTVVVQFKREEQLMRDINQALEVAEQRVTSFAELDALLTEHEHVQQEAVQKADQEMKTEEDETKEEKRDPLELLREEQLFFLKAIQHGWSVMRARFGTAETVTLEELPSFVAVEERACFVEHVQLYYDGPLTRQGVILVDTPGAGSMNARHTEVAFTHIKHADAVVFVTYYNHAFSRADREFLIQLGRVKEYFAKDKMFFVVNAADLAGSEAEIDDVLGHVERNLLACGIRGARLYPVSSQIALLSARYDRGTLSEPEAMLYRKATGIPVHAPLLSGEEGRFFSGLTLFEDDFYAFVIEGLMEAAVEAAYEEIGRVLQVLDSWRAEAGMEEAVRQQKRVLCTCARQASVETLDSLDVDIEQGLLEQEIEELIYYVKQRVFYRYFDEFKLLFNVTNFTDPKEEMQTLLRRYTNEMIRFVAFDLAQEMRATSLRVETFLATTLRSIYERMERELQAHDPLLRFGAYEAPSFVGPTFTEGLHELNASVFADLLAPYKNRSTFFTEEGNVQLRDALEARLRGPVSEYVSECEEMFKRSYIPAFVEAVRHMQEQLQVQVEEYFTGKLAALSVELDTEALDRAYKALQTIYHNRTR